MSGIDTASDLVFHRQPVARISQTSGSHGRPDGRPWALLQSWSEVRQVGEAFGCHCATVLSTLKRPGIKGCAKQRVMNDDQVQMLRSALPKESHSRLSGAHSASSLEQFDGNSLSSGSQRRGSSLNNESRSIGPMTWFGFRLPPSTLERDTTRPAVRVQAGQCQQDFSVRTGAAVAREPDEPIRLGLVGGGIVGVSADRSANRDVGIVGEHAAHRITDTGSLSESAADDRRGM